LLASIKTICFLVYLKKSLRTIVSNLWRAAVAQIYCEPGAREKNLKRAGQMIAQASQAKAQWIIFPECCDIGYDLNLLQQKPEMVEKGYSAKFFSEQASKFQISIVAGIIDKNAKGQILNQAFAVDKNGQTHSYTKSHLFCTPPILEDKVFQPGNEGPAILDWRESKLATMICYDLRFPEIFRKQALAGAESFALPSAWPMPRVMNMRALSIARAIENQAFFLTANQVGRHSSNGLQFGGGSLIIGADGNILAEADSISEKLIIADLDSEIQKKFRSNIPVFQHRRTDLY
jgi:predicted amidohydrolase